MEQETISLDIALEALYQRHDGKPFMLSLWQWVASADCKDTAIRVFLQRSERCPFNEYRIAQKQLLRGWDVCFETTETTYEMRVTLTPPKFPYYADN